MTAVTAALSVTSAGQAEGRAGSCSASQPRLPASTSSATMRADSARNRSAITRPIPRPAPVTTTTLSSGRGSSLLVKVVVSSARESPPTQTSKVEASMT